MHVFSLSGLSESFFQKPSHPCNLALLRLNELHKPANNIKKAKNWCHLLSAHE